MAYLLDYDLTFSTVGGASVTVNMPIHATDDLLVALVGEDGVGTLSMSGWNEISTNLVGNGSSHASALFFKKAASASETGTVTMGTADAISVICMSFRDVDVSTIATTATSGSGTVATITFADQGSTPFPAGTIITVAGVTPTGYNGTYVSTGGTSTTVTYASATTGSQTVAGTITAQIDNAVTPSATAAASQFSSQSITTNKNDALVLYMTSINGVAPMCHTDPGPQMFIISSDSTGTSANTSVGTAAAWYMQRTAGATTAPSWTVDKSAAYNRYTISIRNKTGGRIPAYIDDVISPGTMLDMLTYGAAGTAFNGVTPTASLPYADIGPNGSGKATVYDAIALVADVGINPYSSAASNTPAATAATSAAGWVLTFSAAKNLSSGFVVGAIIASAPKNANFFHGSVEQGGTFLSFGDASNFYRSYQVLARDSKPNTEGRAVFSIQVNQTETRYGYSSSALDASAVTTIMVLTNCPAGTTTLYVCELHLANTQVIAGGDTNYPVDTAGVAAIGKSFRIPIIQQIGATGLLSYVPIQIGGGDAVNFQITAGTLMFPRRWNTSYKEISFHATDGAIGISYAGKSGDTIKHTNSLITSPSSYYWEINSAATSAATWDFSGLFIVGAVVTLRNVMTFSGMSFSNCSSITASGCTMNDCTITNVPATNDSITLSSTTVIQNSSITTTAVTAGNRWCSVVFSDLDIFSGNTFTGSHTSGHAIRISSAGSNTMSGNTFTGYGPTVFGFHTQTDVDAAADTISKTSHGYATGDPIYYQDQGGSDTIGLTDGGLYYVNAVSSSTLSFYDTYANAIAGGATGKQNLSDGAAGQTHYINSAGAAIYNNSGGAVTIDITSGGSIPSIRNSDGSSTTINNTVTLEVNNPNPNFVGARIRIEAAAGGPETVGTQLMSEEAINDGGIYRATQSYNYTSNQPVVIRARKIGFLPFETTGTILSTGLTVTAVWQVDNIA